MLVPSPYKRLVYVFSSTLPVLILLLYLFAIFHKPLLIFPKPENNNIAFYTYEDKSEGGNSVVNTFEKRNDKLVFEYTLKQGIDFPYAGINILIPYRDDYLDISAYDTFELGLSTLNRTYIRLFFRFYIDNYSHEDDFWSFGVLESVLQIEPGKQRYSLPLDSFNIPEWWYSKLSSPPPMSGKPDLRRVSSINLDANSILTLERPESLVVRSLTFHKSAVSFYGPVAVFCLLYACSFSLWFVRVKRKNNIKNMALIRGYRQTAMTNYKDEEFNKIMDFIKTNYSEPAMSVNTVYAKTGINIRKINQLIKEMNLGSFTQLINSLRIEEAKRLLLATDRQILEIALAVGFSNVVHYNRVFREQAGMTPKEYRLKLKSKDRA